MPFPVEFSDDFFMALFVSVNVLTLTIVLAIGAYVGARYDKQISTVLIHELTKLDDAKTE